MAPRCTRYIAIRIHIFEVLLGVGDDVEDNRNLRMNWCERAQKCIAICDIKLRCLRRAASRACCARAAMLVVTCDVTGVAGPLSLVLLPALLPACVCCARVTVAAVVIITCLMLPVFRCVACAGCFALGALLVVTCDVTWAAEPLSFCCYLCCYLRVCAVRVLPSWVWWW